MIIKTNYLLYISCVLNHHNNKCIRITPCDRQILYYLTLLMQFVWFLSLKFTKIFRKS